MCIRWREWCLDAQSAGKKKEVSVDEEAGLSRCLPEDSFVLSGTAPGVRNISFLLYNLES